MRLLLIFLTIILFSFNANAKKEDFKQWTCYEHFGEDAKAVLTIGYFPNSYKVGESVGIMSLKTNNKMLPVFHYINGIKDSFSWGKEGNEYELMISVGDGRSWVYDFSRVKKGKLTKPLDTLNCKDRITIQKDPIEFENVVKEVGWDKSIYKY